ncbi:putative oligomeric golgi complex component 8 [Trypanosoma vivax]|uniref:Conserved oligomeric Golgi complex subunit 8 n=1 Tax=Trypanosoma vivax (strain Y486) TaxID=1055687 RepID=G0UD26_TRYVY|nr:putative oligomeric golgi complex component 8 [Trypanosoma vivax]CCC53736.1 putative oligomeric golgi complex component 8 [Trypanosoma vivax Y486]
MKRLLACVRDACTRMQLLPFLLVSGMNHEVSDESRVRHSIVEATVEHFALFTETQDVNARVAAAAGNSLNTVERLSDSLSKLQKLSQAIVSAGQQWREKKQVALNAVAQHPKLLVFLEAPALLSDCLRKEMYHEALAVLEHIRRSVQSMENIELFCRLEDETRATLENALGELVLPRLAGQLTVASAVKITTFFRRLGVPEAQIRRIFLQKRGEYVSGLFQDAENNKVPHSRIFGYLTVFKVYVIDVVLQFCACFSPDTESGLCCDLAEWCHRRAFIFVQYLRSSLEKITNGSELASIIEQCSVCGSAAAQVHMDVSSLVNEAIAARVRGLLEEHLSQAAQSYATSMATFSWRPPSGSLWSAPQCPKEGGGVVKDGPASAPLCLLQYLPLAYVLNGILTAFNTIRKCVVPGVELFCISRVEEIVRMMANDLAQDKDLLLAVESDEKQAYLQFVNAFVCDFYPHVLICVQELLGDKPKHVLENRMRSAIESLRSLIPSQIDSCQAEIVQQSFEGQPQTELTPMVGDGEGGIESGV